MFMSLKKSPGSDVQIFVLIGFFHQWERCTPLCSSVPLLLRYSLYTIIQTEDYIDAFLVDQSIVPLYGVVLLWGI